MKKVFYILFLILLLSKSSFAQISGIINYYTKVTAIDLGCNKLTVASSSNFAVGDTVLIIQMQGATMDQTNTASFGNITAINNAGNYEFAHISEIVGNDVYLKNTLLKNYTPSGSVQMIYVPQFTDVTISGTLTAQAWNGNTGGVLAFVATGTVTMDANIDISGLGFRGGDVSVNNNSYGCGNTTGLGSSNDYYYTFPSPQGGKKGEGIVAYIAARESGKGKNATGGGGGNGHNSGGAGGSNYGAGGKGGDKISSCSSGLYPNGPGIGGAGLGGTYYDNAVNKIFMGGGGGGGQQNNFANGGPGPPSYWTGGTPGGPGGGIAIIKAGTINGNSNSILANGTLHPTLNNAWGDGGGGGGAGGTVLISATNYTSPLNVTVNGNRGDNVYDESGRDPGPGGGGGGGVIWLSSANAAVVPSVSGGTNGVTYGPGTCACSRNAAPGANGIVLTGLSIPESASSFTQLCISLPVEMLKFTGKIVSGRVRLDWVTANEKNNLYFTIEKSSDLSLYTLVTKIKGNSNSSDPIPYTVYDEEPWEGISYYRLLQTDMDGSTRVLGIVSIRKEMSEKIIRKVYPVPFQQTITVELNSRAIVSEEVSMAIYNSIGELVFESHFPVAESVEVDLNGLSSGMYSLIVQTDQSSEVVKLIK